VPVGIYVNKIRVFYHLKVIIVCKQYKKLKQSHIGQKLELTIFLANYFLHQIASSPSGCLLKTQVNKIY